mgnify:FL=1|jgi:hypothetical protein
MIKILSVINANTEKMLFACINYSDNRVFAFTTPNDEIIANVYLKDEVQTVFSVISKMAIDGTKLVHVSSSFIQFIIDNDVKLPQNFTLSGIYTADDGLDFSSNKRQHVIYNGYNAAKLVLKQDKAHFADVDWQITVSNMRAV